MNYFVSMALSKVREAADAVEQLDGQADSARRLRNEADAIEGYFAPDIDLSTPDFSDSFLDAVPVKVPFVRASVVDGRGIQFVNWVDYRGWEVRVVDPFDHMDNAPKALGFINHSESDLDGPWRVKRLPEGLAQRKSFPRVDTAVRYLLGLS